MTAQTTTVDTRHPTTRVSAAGSAGLGATLAQAGELATRYSVVLVLLWIGAMKFTAYEATAIEGLVASSPLVSWLYGIFSVQATSNLIGTIEILTAIALIVGARQRQLAILGSLAAIGTFVVTLSFLFTAPGWEASLGGFPALSVVPGQFLLKDVVLLAVSVSLLGKALQQD
ncbi:YkgB family protein [Granulosicoccus sp. 3-233]|uniref:YkgB family protein n=1 Tax=Granulosicoccus sp. 3-233 TaxID=3417969 RepID=UPI003D340C7F